VAVLSFIAYFLSISLLVLAGFLALETLAALWPKKAAAPAPARGDATATVVIPAHNESGSIGPTLDRLKGELAPGDRVLVVADNCDDATADIARAKSADVVERKDPKRRGKGYALQFAVDHLRAAPPKVVVFLDADCVLEGGALARLVAEVEAADRPAQGLYLMRPSGDAGGESRQAVAAFAWLFLNRVRMRGLARLFGVTRITGSGVALPWPLAMRLQLATGDIVEDLRLTIKCAKAGAPPRFVEDAVVTSVFPSTDRGGALQRARWEHGSLRIAALKAVPAIIQGLFARNMALAAIGFDLLIPPLTVFVILIGLSLLLGGIAAVLGPAAPLRISLIAATLFTAAVLAGWLRFGLRTLTPGQVWRVVPFLLSKARVYGREARGSTKSWTRAERNGEAR